MQCLRAQFGTIKMLPLLSLSLSLSLCIHFAAIGARRGQVPSWSGERWRRRRPSEPSPPGALEGGTLGSLGGRAESGSDFEGKRMEREMRGEINSSNSSSKRALRLPGGFCNSSCAST